MRRLFLFFIWKHNLFNNNHTKNQLPYVVSLLWFYPVSSMTYQSFWCVSSEERLARLAGYGIKVVSKSSVPTHATVFVLFILACFVCQVIRTQVHWSMVRICHAWHGVAVWIFKAVMKRKTKIKATAITRKLSIWMFLFLLSPSLSSQSISDLLSLSFNHILLLTVYCC